MRVISSSEHLQTALQDFRDHTEANIVLHGTPRIVRVGDELLPRVSQRPARDDKRGIDIQWDMFEPFVYGVIPDHPDVATFSATVMGVAPPYTAGVRQEPDSPTIHYMANPEVKSEVYRLNPLGTVCALLSTSFGESPNGTLSIEKVSTTPVRVIGAWVVQYGALSFDLTTLPPLTIPGLFEIC